jgi:hypothetical protein
MRNAESGFGAPPPQPTTRHQRHFKYADVKGGRKISNIFFLAVLAGCGFYIFYLAGLKNESRSFIP